MYLLIWRHLNQRDNTSATPYNQNIFSQNLRLMWSKEEPAHRLGLLLMQDKGAPAFFSSGFMKFSSEKETHIKDVIKSFSSPVCCLTSELLMSRSSPLRFASIGTIEIKQTNSAWLSVFSETCLSSHSRAIFSCLWGWEQFFNHRVSNSGHQALALQIACSGHHWDQKPEIKQTLFTL